MIYIQFSRFLEKRRFTPKGFDPYIIEFMVPGSYVQEEIAKMTGVSQNTISRKFRRIKKHLTGIYREAV